MNTAQPKNHNDTLIKASGKYDVETALYEYEEYPDDFEDEEGEQVDGDEDELS
jgi:hypothetical protein